MHLEELFFFPAATVEQGQPVAKSHLNTSLRAFHYLTGEPRMVATVLLHLKRNLIVRNKCHQWKTDPCDLLKLQSKTSFHPTFFSVPLKLPKTHRTSYLYNWYKSGIATNLPRIRFLIAWAWQGLKHLALIP